MWRTHIFRSQRPRLNRERQQVEQHFIGRIITRVKTIFKELNQDSLKERIYTHVVTYNVAPQGVGWHEDKVARLPTAVSCWRGLLPRSALIDHLLAMPSAAAHRT